MPAITIQVDEETAKVFAEATPEYRRKLELWAMLRLQDLIRIKGAPVSELMELMDKIGDEAEARGMTPEILESILNER